MKFRNYCIVIVGNTKAVYPEINKVSEGKANILDGKGMVIATFTSFIDPSELKEFFQSNDRSFLLFDLNKDNSGFHIAKPEIQNSLFGFLDEMDDEMLKNKSDEFLSVLKNTSSTAHTETLATKCLITEKDILSMSKLEKQDLFNKIIDAGVENLTEHDKKILDLLVK
jgi:hypothetical protein